MIRCRPNPIIPIIHLSAFTVIVFISFFYFLYSHKKKREVLKKLSNYLMGSISKFSFVPSFSGFNVLLIDSKKLLIKKPNYNLEQDLEPSKVIDILQKLTLLTKGL